jgi:thioredoxin-like negative regulator of GroEL
MTERLLLASTLIASIGLAGLMLQTGTRHWRERRFGALTLAPAVTQAPRIIAFSGPGCAMCRTQRRVLEAVLAEWTGDIDVSYVDAVDAADLARRFGVVVVPTTVIAAPDGRVIGINGGLADHDRLLRQLCDAAG